MTTEKSPFLLGINYWPAQTAMYWWKQFDAAIVDDDFARIAAYGMRAVRFFLLWEDFQPDPDRVNSRRLRDLVSVLDCAGRHGLRAIPTLLVGNMSGVMWFPAWAFTDRPEHGGARQIADGKVVRREVRSPFADPFMLRAEALLAREAAGAIAGHPALQSWDLANEIDQVRVPDGPDAGWLWAWCVSQALRAADPSVAVTYGAHSLSLTTDGLTVPALAPSLDYLSMHGYPIYSDIARGPLDEWFVPFITALTAALGGKPAIMQEFGLPTTPPGCPSTTVEDDFLGEMKPQFLASEEDAARYVATVLDHLWETGIPGALLWVYADYVPALFDRAPLDRAVRERTFGLFRADGTPKPAADAVRRFAAEIQSGELTTRLGPHGSRTIPLDVDPAAYYRDPIAHFRRSYRKYLASAGVQAA